jgi:hypothetical protein
VRVLASPDEASPHPPEMKADQNDLGGLGGVAPQCEMARVQESGREVSPTNALTRAVRA